MSDHQSHAAAADLHPIAAAPNHVTDDDRAGPTSAVAELFRRMVHAVCGPDHCEFRRLTSVMVTAGDITVSAGVAGAPVAAPLARTSHEAREGLPRRSGKGL